MNDEQAVVIFDELVDANDVPIVADKSGHHLGLAAEVTAGHGIVDRSGCHLLDGDKPIQQSIAGFVYDGIVCGADSLQDAVLAESRPRWQTSIQPLRIRRRAW